MIGRGQKAAKNSLRRCSRRWNWHRQYGTWEEDGDEEDEA